jgi:hypothetical protein
MNTLIIVDTNVKYNVYSIYVDKIEKKSNDRSFNRDFLLLINLQRRSSQNNISYRHFQFVHDIF